MRVATTTERDPPMTTDQMADLRRSNGLADLAARIKPSTKPTCGAHKGKTTRPPRPTYTTRKHYRRRTAKKRGKYAGTPVRERQRRSTEGSRNRTTLALEAMLDGQAEARRAAPPRMASRAGGLIYGTRQNPGFSIPLRYTFRGYCSRKSACSGAFTVRRKAEHMDT